MQIDLRPCDQTSAVVSEQKTENNNAIETAEAKGSERNSCWAAKGTAVARTHRPPRGTYCRLRGHRFRRDRLKIPAMCTSRIWNSCLCGNPMGWMRAWQTCQTCQTAHVEITHPNPNQNRRSWGVSHLGPGRRCGNRSPNCPFPRRCCHPPAVARNSGDCTHGTHGNIGSPSAVRVANKGRHASSNSKESTLQRTVAMFMFLKTDLSQVGRSVARLSYRT